MTINGTLASMDAVFNTSSARSPPTNIERMVIDTTQMPRING